MKLENKNPSGTIREYSPSDALRSDRSARDRQRHRKIVREAIRGNIGEILAEESLVGKNRDKIIKVPIRGMKEYRFIYGENAKGVGQGDGNSQSGQVVGSAEGEKGQGQDKAGEQPGVDYYETDVTLDELIEIMFEDLELPYMERKILREVMSERLSKRKGYRNKGIEARRDNKKTIIEHTRRKIASGFTTFAKQFLEKISNAQYKTLLERYADDTSMLHKIESWYFREGDSYVLRFPFHQDDLVYRHLVFDTRPESNAVVICIMDTSGSMDTMKKYLARTFFFLLYQFVCTKYRNVKIVFIAHHTEGHEVTEEEFFHKGESGGTFISSGYNKALDIIRERYHPTLWNVYAFHCSDGDNSESDNPATIKAAEELCDTCNLFGYGEIKPLGSGYYGSSMLKQFEKVTKENFKTILIEKKEDLWPSFKAFLAKEKQRKEES